MNYLAHAYLSFLHPDIVVGNMISDFVKGKKKFNYSPGIQRGIAIHRAIDEFTDSHSATKAARKFFQPYYGLYSAVFMDIVYDHFLACDHREFSDNSLREFSQNIYGILQSYDTILPENFRLIYPYMKEHDWLYNYKNFLGIKRSFAAISHRALYMTESLTAFKLFTENYSELHEHYDSFFPSLKQFALDQTQSS